MVQANDWKCMWPDRTASRCVQRSSPRKHPSVSPVQVRILANTAKRHSDPSSDLEKLIQDAIPLNPARRADLLYESEALESAHQSAAGDGDTRAPTADDNVDLHYVCFVKSGDDNLWELDGRRKGPLNRGKLSADEDVLSERALDLGPRSFLKRESEAGGGDLRFSLITLAESLD